MTFIDKDILPKIIYDEVKFALQCRGKLKHDEEFTKVELVELLHNDIVLEKKVLGERAHKAIKEIEAQVAGLLIRKRNKLADKFLKRIDELWAPLREVQAEEQAAAVAKKLAASTEEDRKTTSNYVDWRKRIAQKREEAIPEEEDYTPRGQGIKIPLIGATPRGMLYVKIEMSFMKKKILIKLILLSVTVKN